MSQPLDIAKFVGAASAPVALIIATSIFVSNLTGRFTAMDTVARQMATEYREKKEKERDARSESLRVQIGLYHRRLQVLIRGTFWLTVAIWSFIGTVFFTSVSVVLPGQPVWPIVTGVTMLGGLVLLAYAVALEAWENHMAKDAMKTEMSEFPEVDLNESGKQSKILQEAHT